MMQEKILKLLEENARLSDREIAVMLGISEEEAAAAVAALEKSGVVKGYHAVVEWERVDPTHVTAIIELKVSPKRDSGFDEIAERIMEFEEVDSVYLMSGAFDLTVIISGRTLKEVAQFVGQRLAPLEGVTATATHFILKKYKEKHLIFEKRQEQEREWIFV